MISLLGIYIFGFLVFNFANILGAIIYRGSYERLELKRVFAANTLLSFVWPVMLLTTFIWPQGRVYYVESS